MHTKLVFPLTDSDESCSILKIDLAGSERASATLNSGLRLNEGAKINRSLLALANCINKLAQQEQDSSVDGKVVTRSRRASTGSTNKSVVNYRDSKLTHLLKSSLEGSCRMIMIANISNAKTGDVHSGQLFEMFGIQEATVVLRDIESKEELEVAIDLLILSQTHRNVR